jgi:hypothetical protein
MPPLPVIDDVFRVSVHHFDGVGHDSYNVMHFLKTGGVSADIETALEANMTAGCWAPLSNTFGGCEVAITPLDGSSVTHTFTPSPHPAWEGGASGDTVPEAAFGLTLQTDTRGRSYRGRLFIGPVTEPQIAAGAFSVGGAVAAWTASWSTFLNDMVTDSVPMVVASYKLATAAQVTSVRGHTGVRTQRGRLINYRGTS